MIARLVERAYRSPRRLDREPVERLGVPAVTTIAAKSLVPEGHPLSLGAALASQGTHDFVRRCKHLLVIGRALAEADVWRNFQPLQRWIVRAEVDFAQRADPRCRLSSRSFKMPAQVEALFEHLPRQRPLPDVSLAAFRGSAVAEGGVRRARHRAVFNETRPGMAQEAAIA